MNRTRWVIAGLTAAVGLFLLVGGAIVVVNGTPYQYTYTSYTGSWGAIPALIGLVVLGFLAFVIWDESR